MHIQTLPYPRFIGIKHKKNYVLPESLFLEQWIVPKDTAVVLISGRDFGFVILPANCQDERGFTIPKRIFKYYRQDS